jgi:hypothetical protein
MRVTYAENGLPVTSFGIRRRARNGPTFGCRKMLSIARSRSALIGRFGGAAAPSISCVAP